MIFAILKRGKDGSLINTDPLDNMSIEQLQKIAKIF